VNWLIEKEYVRTAEDIVWRRSKLGLRLSKKEIDLLDVWIAKTLTKSSKQKEM
jgi:glycerol-3-phosphate dehydrogenase